MTSPYDTNPQTHITALAEELKGIDSIKAPEWAAFVRTGPHKTRAPAELDWWHTRVAAILRSVGTLGPIGVNKLRKKYGGRQRRGYKPSQFCRASGNIIRKSLQQLEQAGLIKQVEVAGHKGRVLTPKGQSLLAQSAKKANMEAKSA